MKMFRLDQLEGKYQLMSQAASMQEVLENVKRELINAYKLYVDPKTAKEPALKLYADAGEDHASRIFAHMTSLMANLDDLAVKPANLYRAVNKILGLTNALDVAMKSPSGSPERLPGESVRNQLRDYQRKLGTVVQRLSSILSKQAKVLHKFAPEAEPLAGSPTTPSRKPLSKDKLLMFIRTPAAQARGLDDLDVFTKVLQYPELREKVTTLINAIDRGHLPKDGPEIMAETAEIKRLFDEKATHQALFEAGEGEAQQALRQLKDPGEEWSRQMQERKKELALEREEGDESNLDSKYSSLTFEQWVRR